MRVYNCERASRRQVGGDFSSPLATDSNCCKVSHNARGANTASKCRNIMRCVSLQQYEWDIMGAQLPLHRMQPFQHEPVLPDSCSKKPFNQVEADYERLIRFNCFISSVKQCMVISYALITRHPQDYRAVHLSVAIGYYHYPLLSNTSTIHGGCRYIKSNM